MWVPWNKAVVVGDGWGLQAVIVFELVGLGNWPDVEEKADKNVIQQLNWHLYCDRHLLWQKFTVTRGFSDSSVGKESACNVGDRGSIPGSERSAGEGIGYPLQYSWASLVAQLVNNLPAMWETWVRSLAWEDLLEKGKATHSSILAWRIPWIV